MLPTSIQSVEVFDSEGGLALQIRGYDVIHMRVVSPQLISRPEVQGIIDRVVEALGFDENGQIKRETP